MSHSGQWDSRMKMAWSTWVFGALLATAGSVGLFMGKDTGTLVVSGISMITGVVAIVVGGKVIHDKGKPDA
jgi:hypothetical protein